jgi:endonuclease/exonuclease/phosphatase family metal-dependent hydrolase
VSQIKTAGIISLVAALIILNGCSEHERIVARNVQFTTVQIGEVRAMTFNIRVDTFLDGFNRWCNRKDMVFDILADHTADVVGIQEALYHQVQQIQQALPQYSNYAAGRTDGKQKGESCAIFYRKDRFILDDFGTFWFSDTPAMPGSKDWGNIWPRICSWVHLVEIRTGAGLYVYNVHLAVFSQNSRKKSMELLAERIAARKNPSPFIVTGDFNMKLNNPAMKHLHNVGMVDAWQSANSHQPTNKSISSGPKIDHISLSDDIVAMEANVDRRRKNGRRPSDHYPVIAKIRIPVWETAFARTVDPKPQSY